MHFSLWGFISVEVSRIHLESSVSNENKDDTFGKEKSKAFKKILIAYFSLKTMEQDTLQSPKLAGIDYTKIEGLQRKRILTFVNHFVVQTTHFLSNFSQTCDLKLLTLANKLNNIETSLTLLELKLNSVPGNN